MSGKTAQDATKDGGASERAGATPSPSGEGRRAAKPDRQRRDGQADVGTIGRRGAVGALVASLVGAASALTARGAGGTERFPRPPGALEAGAFESACSRCFKCSSVCPNSCIKHYGLERGLRQAWTPYIEPRDKGCTLCGECAKACPTGALVEFEPTRAGWKQGVEMGVARINEGQCLSFNGRTCGACYRACPLSGEAIKIGLFETPHVNPDVCVGCGLCEQACLHLPQAIRVESRELLQIRGKWSGREADTRDLRQEVRRDGGPDNGELDKERIEEGKT